MRKNLGRLLWMLAAMSLAVGFALPAAGASVSRAKTPPSVPGFDGKTIKLGVLTPLSGIASVIGKPLTNGNQTYWDAVNAAGGVGGKYKVQLSTKDPNTAAASDTKYDTATALQGYDQIKTDVVAFQQVLGTQIMQAVLQRLKADQLTAAPATLDSLWVKVPQLVPIGAPYQVEAANGFDYYINKGGGKGKKICALVQDDDYGTAGLQGLNAAAKQLKFTVASTAKFAATATDVSAQVGQLADAKCDAVFLASLPNVTGSIVSKMIGRSFTPQILALAPSWLSGFESSPDSGAFYAQHFWLLSEGPNWGDTSVPGMAKMLGDLQKYSPDQKPDQYFAFGYAESWAMDQVLEQAVKNGDLSKAGIQKALKQVGTLKFQNLVGDYLYGSSAANRNPPRDTTIFKVVNGKPVGLDILVPSFVSPTAKALKF
ncbi:MAG TPA: ABC transporter substrate-binding protein [Acidimicrobiia bacterium]|nr:ABC transporter substrate-binding protein [Acidimicrobiia bacterium]